MDRSRDRRFRPWVALALLAAAGALFGVWTARSPRWAPPDRTVAIASVDHASRMALQGDFAAAVVECRRALSQDPHVPVVYRVLGWCYYRLKRYPEARVALAEALRQKPDDAFATCFVGLIDAETATDPGAERRARAALERAAMGYHGAEPWYGLGLLALRRHRPGEAIVHFKKAVEMDPGWESGHYRLAEAYRLAGDWKAAQRELRVFDRLKRSRSEYERLLREVAADPGAEATRLRLARLCLDTHRYREALDQFYWLADRSPRRETFDGVARAAAALGQDWLATKARRAAAQARR